MFFLKVIPYVNKATELRETVLFTISILFGHAAFVDKNMGKDTYFNKGDNIELIQHDYPTIQLLSSPLLLDEKFFEIKCDDTVYSYFVDDSGTVTRKERINIAQVASLYS